MKINYCDCSGVMSKCKARNDPVGQTVCGFNPIDGQLGCPYLRKELDGHCDNPKAQYAAMHKDTTVVVKTLTEEDVFDIRNKETYPTY